MMAATYFYARQPGSLNTSQTPDSTGHGSIRHRQVSGEPLMDRHTIFGIILSLLLPAVMIPANIVWQKWNDFHEFEQYLEETSKTIDDINSMEDAVTGETYTKNVEEWNKQATHRLNRLFSTFSNENNDQIDSTTDLNRKLFKELMRLKVELSVNVEPLFSKEMTNKKTVGDTKVYEWRMHTLDNIHQYLLSYDERVDKTIDEFRQSMIDSSMPEKYRVYTWHEWFPQNRDKIKMLASDPSEYESRTSAFSKFYDYMYSHKDGFYITESGDIVITNQRYVSDYRSLLQSMGPS